MWRLWMNQYCFSLGFLSQNSLWKLSTFRGYKGLYIVGWEGMQKVSFSQTGWSGDLASRLGWVASSSRELTAWLAWDFCPVVQQLAWRFRFWHAWHVCIILVACSREPPTSPSFFAQTWVILHTLPLHDSHLNTGLLIAKIQTNLTRNKANKMVDKIQPYTEQLTTCNWLTSGQLAKSHMRSTSWKLKSQVPGGISRLISWLG